MKICILIVLFFAELSLCSQIVISGIITEAKQENHVQAGDVRSYLFEIKIEGCRWNIKLSLDPDSMTNLVIRTRDETGYIAIPNICEAGSDGMNFYFYQSARKASDELNLKHGIDTTSSLSHESVKGPGNFPFRIDQKILALWYTYCSNCYFEEVSAGENLFISLQDYGPEFQKYKKPVLPGKVNIYEGFGSYKLPTKLVLYEDPDRVLNVQKAIGKNDASVNSFLSTHLKVKEIGDVLLNGVQVRVPKSTIIKNFGLDVKENKVLGNKMLSQLDIVLETTDFIHPKTPLQAGDFIPVLNAKSLYSDLNSYLKGIDVGFMATDGWPGNDQVQNSENIHQNIASGSARANSEFFSKRKYIGILFVCVVFAAGYFLLLRKSNKLTNI